MLNYLEEEIWSEPLSVREPEKVIKRPNEEDNTQKFQFKTNFYIDA